MSASIAYLLVEVTKIYVFRKKFARRPSLAGAQRRANRRSIQTPHGGPEFLAPPPRGGRDACRGIAALRFSVVSPPCGKTLARERQKEPCFPSREASPRRLVAKEPRE